MGLNQGSECVTYQRKASWLIIGIKPFIPYETSEISMVDAENGVFHGVESKLVTHIMLLMTPRKIIAFAHTFCYATTITSRVLT